MSERIYGSNFVRLALVHGPDEQPVEKLRDRHTRDYVLRLPEQNLSGHCTGVLRETNKRFILDAVGNHEHIQLIRQGVQVWNRWRIATSEVPDLLGATIAGTDLTGADLSNVTLMSANLVGTNLTGANLNGARLSGAKLVGAILTKASLNEADLSRADLSGGHLSDTNFSKASLGETNLVQANLKGANLSDAWFRETNFGNTNLKGVIGLGTCRHGAPSNLDVRTLAKSWPLPLEFLRGCGIPDKLIAYLPALLQEAIQFSSCFISYSFADQSFADRLYTDLQNNGVRCWFAPHDIAAGKKVHEQIAEAILLHDRLLLILSENSMRSRWVETEISKARKRELQEGRRMLFPVRLTDFEALRDWECFDADSGKDSAREIREYFIPDFSNWEDHDCYTKALKRLLMDLRALPDPNTGISHGELTWLERLM